MTTRIRIFATGGTMDREKIDSGKYFFTKTHLPEMLQQGRNKVFCDIEVLIMKDSLLMTDSDRVIIAEKCSSCLEEKIVITHGTDTATETAVYLGKRIRNKTIVLVGAMIPYNQKFSDSLYNLGAAIANVQLLPFGVYLCMNGQVFSWNNVRKNTELGVFETLT